MMIAPAGAPLAPTVAAADDQLIALWLHGRSVHTQRAYMYDVAAFRRHCGRELAAVTLADIQAWADSLGQLSPVTRARRISAIKSLMAFGHRLGVLPVDAGRPVRLERAPDTLAERIMPESDLQRMIALEPDRRNRLLLRLLYASAIRISELIGLKWRDVKDRDEGGQVTVWGKGGKTRAVLLPAAVYADLVAARKSAGPMDPVFSAARGGPLHQTRVRQIVAAAGRRAGIAGRVSPHWLRHAHASHAMDRGAPIHLVQTTLGHASVSTTGRYLHARPNDSSARFLVV